MDRFEFGVFLLILLISSTLSFRSINQDTVQRNNDSLSCESFDMGKESDLDEFKNFVGVSQRISFPSFDQYEAHDPIFIDGNANFSARATAEGWSGNGSQAYPYVISGLSITGPSGSNLIDIQDTSVHFQIKNCLLINGTHGICFTGVINGQVINTSIYDNHIGIIIESSSRTALLGNTVYDNGGGIVIEYSSNSSLVGNNASSNFHGVALINSTRLNLSSNIISTSYYGLTLDFSSFNILSGNQFTDNEYGIILYGLTFYGSSFNTLSSNQITDNKFGIFLHSSGNNTILGNVLVNSTFYVQGVQVTHFFQQLVLNNSVNGKQVIYWQNRVRESIPNGAGQVILINCEFITLKGQELVNLHCVYCSHLDIQHNVISGGISGISLWDSPHSVLVDNTIANHSYCGIELWRSGNSTLTRNIVSDNLEHGIILYKSNCSKLIWNIVSDNGIGLIIRFDGNNSISGNTFSNNDGYGVQLLSTTDNLVHWNNFLNNNLSSFTQAFDDGNNNTFTHNYWSNWNSPDNDADGIVDVPYPIGGQAHNQDFFPLVHPYTPPPSSSNDLPRIIFGVSLFLVLISLMIFFTVKLRVKRNL